MDFSANKTIEVAHSDGVLTVILDRPEKRNAMNAEMVSEIQQVFEKIADDRTIRAVVLRGRDGNFCAGGDISGMNQESQVEGKDASWVFNRSFGHMMTKVNRAPQFVITLLERAVLGGGFGLACVSDLAIAKPNTMFAMPETSLGIVPAQISPFVVDRIGITQARRLTLLGERIDGHTAQSMGIVHHVTEDIDAELQRNLKLLAKCAPNATAVTKELILDMAGKQDLEPFLDRAADDFADAIRGAEGQEGTRAFIEKRKPSWADKL